MDGWMDRCIYIHNGIFTCVYICMYVFVDLSRNLFENLIFVKAPTFPAPFEPVKIGPLSLVLFVAWGSVGSWVEEDGGMKA